MRAFDRQCPGAMLALGGEKFLAGAFQRFFRRGCRLRRGAIGQLKRRALRQHRFASLVQAMRFLFQTGSLGGERGQLTFKRGGSLIAKREFLRQRLLLRP